MVEIKKAEECWECLVKLDEDFKQNGTLESKDSSKEIEFLKKNWVDKTGQEIMACLTESISTKDYKKIGLAIKKAKKKMILGIVVVDEEML